jgi:hypothetical protein
MLDIDKWYGAMTLADKIARGRPMHRCRSPVQRT